jgi:hypothetical protein
MRITNKQTKRMGLMALTPKKVATDFEQRVPARLFRRGMSVSQAQQLYSGVIAYANGEIVEFIGSWTSLRGNSDDQERK